MLSSLNQMATAVSMMRRNYMGNDKMKVGREATEIIQQLNREYPQETVRHPVVNCTYCGRTIRYWDAIWADEEPFCSTCQRGNDEQPNSTRW